MKRIVVEIEKNPLIIEDVIKRFIEAEERYLQEHQPNSNGIYYYPSFQQFKPSSNPSPPSPSPPQPPSLYPNNAFYFHPQNNFNLYSNNNSPPQQQPPIPHSNNVFPIPPPNNPILPQNWIQKFDPKTGRTYYANTVTRQTQWEFPNN